MKNGILSPAPGGPICAALLIALGAVASACGGKVVFEGGGGAGGEGFLNEGGNLTTSVTTTSVTTTGSTTSGGGFGTTSSGMGGEGGPPPIPPLVETDYGEVPVGGTIAIDVPPNTLGLTAILKPDGKYDRAGVETLTPPSGPPIIDNFYIDGTGWEFAWYGITVAGVPQSDAPAAMPVMNGTWQLKVGAPEGGVDKAKVSVWRRQTLDGKFHGGRLDVNVFIADFAVDQQYMTDILHESYDGYAGLTLGTVTFYQLGPEWAVIDSIPQVFDVLEETAGAVGKPALNLIMVQQITGELEGAGGLAAGIPGQGLQHGTHSSGLIAMTFFDPWIDRIILRHEGGHMMGLFHTTEIDDASLGDALSDTPKCSDVMSLLENCPDAFDVMFPIGGYGDEFTAKQEVVIQGSSMYRGIVEEGGGPADPLPIQGGNIAPGGGGGELPGAASFGPAARGGAWSASLPEGMGDLLAGFWCGSTVPGKSADTYRLLGERFTFDAAQLLAVARDPGAPLQARRRALGLAGRTAPSRVTLDALQAIAQAPEAPTSLRLGALEGLRAGAPAEARAIASRLQVDGDRIVARVASRFER